MVIRVKSKKKQKAMNVPLTTPTTRLKKKHFFVHFF